MKKRNCWNFTEITNERNSRKFIPPKLLGGICSEGLLPRNGPVFFTGKNSWLKKHCAKINKSKCTLDNRIYAEFITKHFVRKLRNDLEDDLDEYMWQDDGDKKHRTKHVKEKLNEVFHQRLDPDHQADKMADVWPIENVWGILAEDWEGESLKMTLRWNEPSTNRGEKSVQTSAAKWWIPSQRDCLLSSKETGSRFTKMIINDIPINVTFTECSAVTLLRITIIISLLLDFRR